MLHTLWGLIIRRLTFFQSVWEVFDYYFSNNFLLFIFSILGSTIGSYLLVPYLLFFLFLLFREQFFSSLKLSTLWIYCIVERKLLGISTVGLSGTPQLLILYVSKLANSAKQIHPQKGTVDLLCLGLE